VEGRRTTLKSGEKRVKKPSTVRSGRLEGWMGCIASVREEGCRVRGRYEPEEVGEADDEGWAAFLNGFFDNDEGRKTTVTTHLGAKEGRRGCESL
jgi:hypothetical protein